MFERAEMSVTTRSLFQQEIWLQHKGDFVSEGPHTQEELLRLCIPRRTGDPEQLRITLIIEAVKEGEIE